MNVPFLESTSESVTSPVNLISSAQIKQALTQAQAQQRRVIDVLDELAEQDQETFLQSISQTMHFDAISMREINSLSANFEAIPFSTAQKKECLAFDSVEESGHKSITLVFADPFNDNLQEWVIENIKQPFA